MLQPEINKDISQVQIASFVIDNDIDGVFKSARANRTEFEIALRRLQEVNQIIVWKDCGELRGVLGWFFITDKNKHEVGKTIWRLPQDLVNGDILYLSFISTKGNCDVLAVKKMFEEMGYREKITRRRGFTNGRWYEKRIFREDKII